MSSRTKRGMSIGLFVLAISLGWALSAPSETVRSTIQTPARKTQARVIAITAGESDRILVPGHHPKTQARLATIPKARGEKIRPVPNVTVVPGDEAPRKTGRYYTIQTTAKTPPGNYQLQYYDGMGKSWNAIPAIAVQVRAVAASQPASRLQQAALPPARSATTQEVKPGVAGPALGRLGGDNTYTISATSTGGDCPKMGTWDSATKVCEVVNWSLQEGYTVNVRPGTELKIIAMAYVLGTINNDGKLVVGGFPRKHDSGFTVGGTLTIGRAGRINNKSGAEFLCYTNSYVDILGEVSNQGAIDFDCKVQLKKAQGASRGGLLVNDGTFTLDMGTMGSNNYPSRTINDGNLWTEQGTGIVNKGSISQRENSYGEKTSVVNRGEIDNYNRYDMSGGSIRNWGQFRNICNGATVSMNIVEGNPAVQKPCDRDGDGIPDSSDQCPDEKEIFNGLMDGDGCPDAMGGGSPQ